MKNNKIRVLFVLNKVKINKREECPIKYRITFLGKRKVYFSPQFFVGISFVQIQLTV